jgi:hypothetical protein
MHQHPHAPPLLAAPHPNACAREILRPVAALPALRTATLRLFARRWSFERDVPMDAATLRAWLAERGSRFRLKFPLEAP